MSSALQVLNENNKVSEWAERITECRNSGLSVLEPGRNSQYGVN